MGETSDTEMLITAGAIWMLLGAALAHAISIYKIGFLHESGLYIVLGLFGGSLWLWLSPSDITQYNFSSDVFFDVVLPPIIFSAGYNLKNKQFINNFSPIMVLAIFGALLNFLMMSSIAIGTGGYGLEDSECMLFAALMSATDGVAVVALIDSEAYPTIFGTLIGEGCINDAVAIILYASIDSISTQKSGFAFTGQDLGYISLKVCEIAFFSILVGVSVGLASSLYFKFIRVQASPKTEITILFLFGYLSYSINDTTGMSGIIGVFFCGVIMSHYTYHSLTVESQHASREAFEAMSYAGETFIYISLGFYVFSYTNSGNWNANFLIVMLAVLIFGRVIIVGVCVAMINVCRKGPNRISIKDQMVFVWGGIVRGSICFALSLRKETTHSPIIVTTTFMIVILTTFSIGSLTDTFLRCIGMKDDGIVKSRRLHRKTTAAEDHGRMRYFIQHIDEKYMKPLFGGRKRRLYEMSEDNPEFEESFYQHHYGTAAAAAAAGVMDSEDVSQIYRSGRSNNGRLDQVTGPFASPYVSMQTKTPMEKCDKQPPLSLINESIRNNYNENDQSSYPLMPNFDQNQTPKQNENENRMSGSDEPRNNDENMIDDQDDNRSETTQKSRHNYQMNENNGTRKRNNQDENNISSNYTNGDNGDNDDNANMNDKSPISPLTNKNNGNGSSNYGSVRNSALSNE